LFFDDFAIDDLTEVGIRDDCATFELLATGVCVVGCAKYRDNKRSERNSDGSFHPLILF
jgi:hypothetical protein